MAVLVSYKSVLEILFEDVLETRRGEFTVFPRHSTSTCLLDVYEKPTDYQELLEIVLDFDAASPPSAAPCTTSIIHSKTSYKSYSSEDSDKLSAERPW